MLGSIILALAALGAGALAAPVTPNLDVAAGTPGGMDALSEYFNLLASKVQQSRTMAVAPVCDMAHAVIALGTLWSSGKGQGPTWGGGGKLTSVILPGGAAGSLPAPSAGLTLKHVAIGRGTQNYTCDTSAPRAAPIATGALATLFNASCVAATDPDLLDLLPRVALQFDLSSGGPGPAAAAGPPLPPSDLAISGHHYFASATTPFFDLDAAGLRLGTAPCLKNNSMAAPPGAPPGRHAEPAVAWLKLLARPGATGRLQEVYRVNTAGGSPPATCAGMPPAFEVQYSAQCVPPPTPYTHTRTHTRRPARERVLTPRGRYWFYQD